MKYYIAENGQPAGPFEMEDLLKHGLTPDSQVWNEKMSGWTKACDVPELAQLLPQTTPQQPSSYAPQEQPQEQPSPYAPQEQTSPYAPQGQPQEQPSPYAPQGQPQEQPSSYAPQGQSSYEPQGQPLEQQQQQQGYGQQPSPYAQSQYQQPQQPQYQQPQYQQPQYQQPQYQQGQPQYAPQGFPPKNWMTESVIFTVLSLLCCCNPFSIITGIIAIVNASKVNSHFQRGDTFNANQSAKQAKTWALITLALMIIGMIASVILVMTTPELKEAFMEGYENGYQGV